jgi:signal recognition particle subunit SRP19
MGRIVPYYSPAVTGGGVSEDFFKDMMKEMQGQMPGHPALGGADSGSGSGAPSIPKKQKKKIIRV